MPYGVQGRSITPGSSRWLRPLVLPLAVLLPLVACAEQSRVDPDAVVSVRGQARDVDGSPLAARPVRLGSGVTHLEGGVGVLTAGLFCVAGACSGEFFDTTTVDDGTFSLELGGSDTQSMFGEATSFLLSTSAPPSGSSPAGPAISARFRIQTTEVVLPDLDLLDPGFRLETADGSIDAGWDGAVAPGPYTVSFVGQDGDVVWQRTEAEPSLRLDGRVLEESSGEATVSGSRADATEGSDVTINWRSSSVAFRGGYGPPPSRGATCELHAADGTMQPVDGCGLTDGSFRRASLPTSACPDRQGTSTTVDCRPVERVRVHLPAPIPADLAVVRGCTDPCRASVVTAGSTDPTDVGALSAAFGTVALDGSPVVAVDITTPDVGHLAEISVWSPMPAGPALLPVDDPAGLVETDDGQGGWPAVVAAGLVLVAAVALGVLIGRRSRRDPRSPSARR